MSDPDPITGDYTPQCHFAIMENINLTVPWYLSCSLAYYVHDVSLISDHLFDSMCKMMLLHWDTIEHRHKDLIDPEMLIGGTGYAVAFVCLPFIVQSATQSMIRKYEQVQGK